MSKLNLLFAGAGEFGLLTLRALLDRHNVLQILSQPDKPAGRGNRLTPTPISKFALDQNLPLTRTLNINAETLPPADVLVVIAFGQKIAPHIVNHSRLGSVNLHASRLPKLRGAAPINWSILRGDRTTGNSIIRLAQKMDAGAILAQSELPIGDLETAGELHDRLAEDGAPLMLQTLDQLASNSAIEMQQDESKATLSPKLSRESTKLDFSHPADKLALQIRGLYPWPGCRVRLIAPDNAELAKFTLVRACPHPSSTDHPPSSLLPNGTIACGQSSALEIVELQPESKRPMPLTSYQNGHPWPAGARLESI